MEIYFWRTGVVKDNITEWRDRVRAEIVQTQQTIAARQANFASYVRPEILRNLVVSVTPNAEVISFHKSVSIDAVPMRVVGDTL